MTNQQPIAGRPASRIIPWLAAAAGLAIFLCTVNHWVSFMSLPEVTKASGLAWEPELYNPAYHIVTWPLRFLPAKLIPLALNIFSAVCGAAALGLLARSVMLLPHDRTHDQRLRQSDEKALLSTPLSWLPPIFAAVVCGLTLTFWEHSTNATAETFNLLILAYAIRSLLEYRVSERDSWLYRAAFCNGAAMPNDWMIVGLLPGFIVTLIWLRGLSFFNLRFLGRMFLFGLLGLSLYVVMPIFASQAKIDAIGFWDALKLNVAYQKFFLMTFPHKELLLVALYSLVPVILLSIKWASYFGDNSPLGVALATAIFHIVHFGFLLGCLWVLLDPAFSPRNQNYDRFTFLFLYYLATLSIGYFAGYFLVVFRDLPARGRRPSSLLRFLNKVAYTVVITLAIAAPVALVFVNLPSVRTTNTSRLDTYARQSLSAVPKGSALLTDHPLQSSIVQLWLIRNDRVADFLVVNTFALKSPGYIKYARGYFGKRWPAEPQGYEGKPYDSRASLEFVQKLAALGELYYLHSSFGVYFEYFYAVPEGLVYHLKPFAPQDLLAPRLTPAQVETNEKTWQTIATAFPAITSVTDPDPQAAMTVRRWLTLKLRLKEPKGNEAWGVGALYSRELNNWGVELQKTGDFKRSASHFEMALRLHPENSVAKVNLEFNHSYQAGRTSRVAEPRAVEEFFGEGIRSWDMVLNLKGFFDEPSLCYRLAREYYVRQFYRQAAQSFERVRTLSLNDLASTMFMAQLNLLASHPERAVELTRAIIENPNRFKGNTNEMTDALCMLGRSLLKQGDPASVAEAERLLEAAATKVPPDPYILAGVTTVYRDTGRSSNALVNIERQLKLRPDEPASLFSKGLTQIDLNDCAGAIVTLTRLQTIETNSPPDVLLNRAIAYVRCGKLDEAKKDYETLQRKYPTVPQIPFGLQEIAWQRKDTNACILYIETYLSNSIPDSAEAQFLGTRLRALRGQSAEPPPKSPKP